MSVPSPLYLLRTKFVCDLCRLQRLQHAPSRTSNLTATPYSIWKKQRNPSKPHSTFTTRARRHQSASKLRRPTIPLTDPYVLKRASKSASSFASETDNIKDDLQQIRASVNAIAASAKPPDGAIVLDLLEKAQNYANILILGSPTAPSGRLKELEENDRKDGIIGDLEELPPTSAAAPERLDAPNRTMARTTVRAKAAFDLCQTMYSLLKDPKVHIEDSYLSVYTRTICLLGRPEYLPEIFFLYANKPYAIEGARRKPHSPIRYKDPSPNSAKNAISQELSDAALDTAILQRDLPLAIAIIDTTVATRAFRRSKFFRKAALPLGILATTPVTAYAAADWLSRWQVALDETMAKTIALAGAAAYVGTLSTIMFVAVTTYNDHHDRVVWQQGTPLRERWLREEERLYFDRIAVTWGFSRRSRRGEEMGEEWEALRQVLGSRGMVLDKSELMDGMQ